MAIIQRNAMIEMNSTLPYPDLARAPFPAGVSEVFRSLLSTSEQERGSFVWLSNFEAEQFWTRPGLLQLPSLSRASDVNVVNRLEEMTLFLAQAPDIFIQRHASDEGFLEYLNDLGLQLPTILTTDPEDGTTPISKTVLGSPSLCARLRHMATEQQLYLLPYAITHLEEEIGRLTGIRCVGPTAAVCAKVNSKIYGRTACREIGLRTIPGGECESIEALERAYEELADGGFMVIKEAMGVSGRGLVVIDSPRKFQSLRDMLKRRQGTQSHIEFVMERWIDKARDINYLIFVEPSGRVRPLGIKEAVTQNGIHLGHRWPPALTAEQRDCYLKAGEAIGRRLHADGFVGVAGIDSVIDHDGVVFPVLEINARFNMSTYELRLDELTGGAARMEVKFYPLSLNTPLNFSKLASLLGPDLFSRGKSEGIGIFCFATANCNFTRDAKLPVKGRVYAFLAAADQPAIDRLDGRMKHALEESGAALV